MKVGDIEIIPLSDGVAKLPPVYFPNADWTAHQGLLNEEGVIVIPIGCFVIKTGERTVLVDAGLGPVDSGIMKGGDLPDLLRKSGLEPSDIDLVIASHLHLDHVGWLIHGGPSFFPNATVRFGAADWDHFVASCAPGDFIGEGMKSLPKVELIHEDSNVAPGIDTLAAPGHTPGHLCLVVSSGDERALLLGDAVTCPVQLEEPEWQAMSDVDPELAIRTRDSLFKELEASGDITVAAHFPDLKFGRVLRGEGKRYFA